MCGRYTLTMSGERLAEHFGFPELTAAGGRYNIAPGQPIWTLASEDGSPPVPREFGWLILPTISVLPIARLLAQRPWVPATSRVTELAQAATLASHRTPVRNGSP